MRTELNVACLPSSFVPLGIGVKPEQPVVIPGHDVQPGKQKPPKPRLADDFVLMAEAGADRRPLHLGC